MLSRPCFVMASLRQCRGIHDLESADWLSGRHVPPAPVTPGVLREFVEGLQFLMNTCHARCLIGGTYRLCLFKRSRSKDASVRREFCHESSRSKHAARASRGSIYGAFSTTGTAGFDRYENPAVPVVRKALDWGRWQHGEQEMKTTTHTYSEATISFRIQDGAR